MEIGLLALPLSYLSISGLLHLLNRHRLFFDIPNERSSHARPTPRGGGIAIVAITLGGIVVYLLLNSPAWWTAALSYVGGAAVVAVVSWLDDWRSLPYLVRLAAHTVAAAVAILGIGLWEGVGLSAAMTLPFGVLGPVLTLLWIIGLTNAYNFMDGIDGMAGTQAVIGGLAWGIIGFAAGQPPVMVIGLLVAASSAGFLGHNWQPARIFMGDVGSAFLGYTFAVLPLLLAHLTETPRLAAVALPIGGLIVWPFLFDTIFTLLRRWRRGEHLFTAHCTHLYQRLVLSGRSHAAVTTLYALLSAIGALIALAWFFQFALWTTIILPLLALGLWSHVTRCEIQLNKRANEQANLQKPL